MKEQPLVSIFIPYYNDEKFLRQSIESVLNQTYQNWELILLNHATEDACRQIAHSYEDSRIKHIDMVENYGAGGGILFEAMLSITKGKYVKPFCADDIMSPGCLEELISYMENNKNIDFAFGNLEYFDSNGNDLNHNWFDNREGFSFSNDEVALIKLYINGISSLPYIGSIIKTSALKTIEYDKSLVMMFDMSIWLSLLCKGYRIGYVNEIVAEYRIHDGQVSGKKNSKKAFQMSWFERSIFWEKLFLIDDIELAKRVFLENKFCIKLKQQKDIPFFIAVSLFYQYSPMSYMFLNKLLNNNNYLQHIKREFGFGIKEFRDMYSWKKEEESPFHHILEKPAGKLSLIQMILFIPMRLFTGIWNIPNRIKRIISKKNRKEQKYTV